MADASLPMEATSISPASSGPRAGDGWIAIVRKSGTPEFAAAFGPNPVLHASVLSEPCAGVELTQETVDGPRTYLEWEGKAFGKSVGGSTILTRNASGLIENIQIYHRPLPMVLQFSAELENRLRGRVSPSLFAAGD